MTRKRTNAPTRHFVIPEYQRGYSWTILECDKLWQDIEAFMASGEVNESGKKEPYFFGTIIADCSEPNRISLIDGQQRTTTFILLLKALLIRLQTILDEIKRDDDNEFLIDGLKERRNKILDILYKTDADNRREILNNWDKAKGISILGNRTQFHILLCIAFNEHPMMCHQPFYDSPSGAKVIILFQLTKSIFIFFL